MEFFFRVVPVGRIVCVVRVVRIVRIDGVDGAFVLMGFGMVGGEDEVRSCCSSRLGRLCRSCQWSCWGVCVGRVTE